MRRLPVFFVLDCSESMVGEKLKKMQDGLASIIGTLRKDPHALETVYISVIAFAGIAKIIAPLIEVVSFYPPKLPLGGGTSLGAALDTLMAEIDSSVVRSTADRKGDWKPIVYLFTDGRPTDNPNDAIERWQARYATRVTLIALALGEAADLTALRRLTENVVVFEDAEEGDFKKFMSWISASVVSQSRSVGEGADSQALPVLDPSVMKIVKTPTSTLVDENCVTLVGRCQKTRRPYIIRYDKTVQDIATRDFKFQESHYEVAGCYPLEEDYFEWSDPQAVTVKVSTAELLGAPGCPHCGASNAFAVCGCGKLLCINAAGEATCPWCKEVTFFAPSADSFEVGRGRG